MTLKNRQFCELRAQTKKHTEEIVYVSILLYVHVFVFVYIGVFLCVSLCVYNCMSMSFDDRHAHRNTQNHRRTHERKFTHALPTRQ